MAIELQDKLYTSAQVADVLGVSLRTLYRYMEDGRIESMKTASGRHRFTKEQILTFLDGGGLDLDPAEENISSNFPAKSETNFGSVFPKSNVRPTTSNDDDFSFYAKPKQPVREESPFRSAPVEEPNKYQSRVFEEDLDLADDELDDMGDDDFNFNFDNKRSFQQEPAVSNNRPVIQREPIVRETERERVFRERRDFGSATPFQRNENAQTDRYNQFKPSSNPMTARPAPVSPLSRDRDRFGATNPPAESLNIRYYKSDYNDLIDLAKRVKESAITRDLEYAFTLNAGLSLHYPIDPFTLIHFYVNPEDLQAWKSTLGLIPVSTKSEANVGILVNTDVVFIPTKEIAGFKVVEDKLLLKDLTRASEESLVRKFRQHIMGV
jgi:excisionase family DNA binding protein